MISSFKNFYNKYERRLSIGVFVLGFIGDFFTLNRIDQLFDNLVLAFYLLVSGFCIVFYQSYKSGRVKRPFLIKLARFSPLVVQFAFGGLFSGFVIFYSRSANFLSSWPFLLVIFIMFFGNEFFRRRYFKLVFQIGIYYLGLFSYFIFLVPVLWGEIGVPVFVLSGILSLVAILIFILIILHAGKEILIRRKFWIFLVILFIYSGFNIAYFKNWIPPVPLSLKEIGVYHSVSKNIEGDYILSEEPKSFFEYLPFYLERFEIDRGSRAYLFSAIFAPTRLSTDIIHKWYYFDETTWNWRKVGEIRYSISGGRLQGYRGFSFKDVYLGKWRVDVLTTDNRVIGSKKFIVE